MSDEEDSVLAFAPEREPPPAQPSEIIPRAVAPTVNFSTLFTVRNPPSAAPNKKRPPPSALAPSLPMESALERIAIPERDKALRRKAAAAKIDVYTVAEASIVREPTGAAAAALEAAMAARSDDEEASEEMAPASPPAPSPSTEPSLGTLRKLEAHAFLPMVAEDELAAADLHVSRVFNPGGVPATSVIERSWPHDDIIWTAPVKTEAPVEPAIVQQVRWESAIAWGDDSDEEDEVKPVSYTHLTLPTTPYV